MKFYELTIDNYGMGNYFHRGFFKTKKEALKKQRKMQRTVYKNYIVFF